ncbi:MAG: hypothetical protein K8S18_21640, partial [Desulfobacula sp.]|nr:hypothetical protein [Desulfobacula sp.]
MDKFYLITILLSVIGVVVCYYLWHIPRKKRIKNLARYARPHGFVFVAETDIAPKEKFAPLRLFSLQAQANMKNVLKCEKPLMWIFDYEYSIPWDQTVGQTVAVFETNDTKWPQMIMENKKKERFTVAAMKKLTQKFANWQLRCKVVDVSFHPGFSKNYRAFSDDVPEKFKDSIPVSLLDMLSRKPGLNVEMMDRWILIYRQGKYVKPKGFNTFINTVLT